MLFLLCACAKVGDPMPPPAVFPDTVFELDVIQQGLDKVLVVFPLPASPVRKVEIFRACGSDRPRELADPEVADLGRHPDGRWMFPDPSPETAVPCSYRVRFRNAQGRRSEFSNEVSTELVPPPPSPTNLRAEVGRDLVEVRWDVPRGEVPDAVIGFLVNSVELVTENRFVTSNFEFGEPIRVWIQSVGRIQGPMVLSEPSEELNLVPEDKFPPEAPSNLTAIALTGGVQLIWDANQERDLEGYHVYRRDPDAAEFQRVSGLVSVNRYLDSVEPVGGLLYYVVTAVDRWGNESSRSDPVDVSLDR
jgi:hypothetical protein